MATMAIESRLDAVVHPLDRVAEVAGGYPRLAELLGVTRQALYQWKSNKVPAERVLDLERLSKFAILRHDIRPDIYPPPEPGRP